jgi:hypothetical protein
MTGDLDEEWLAILAAATQLAKQEANIEGWLPGQHWGPKTPAAQTGPTAGQQTPPSRADVQDLVWDEAGKASKALTSAQAIEAEWHYREKSPLMNDRLAVARCRIDKRSELKDTHRRRLIDALEADTLEMIDEALLETGQQAVDRGAQQRWRAEYAPQMTNRIELERMRELELAEWAISKLVETVEGQGDDNSIFSETLVLKLTRDIRDRLRWGQTCVARLTTKVTTFGALKARKKAITDMNAVNRVGRKQTRTIAQIRGKELEAADQAEKDHIKNMTGANGRGSGAPGQGANGRRRGQRGGRGRGQNGKRGGDSNGGVHQGKRQKANGNGNRGRGHGNGNGGGRNQGQNNGQRQGHQQQRQQQNGGHRGGNSSQRQPQNRGGNGHQQQSNGGNGRQNGNGGGSSNSRPCQTGGQQNGGNKNFPPGSCHKCGQMGHQIS